MSLSLAASRLVMLSLLLVTVAAGGTGASNGFGISCGFVDCKLIHCHRHAELMEAAAEANAFHWRRIRIIAPNRQHDVFIADHGIVGRIEMNPAVVRRPHREPRMRGVGADAFTFTLRADR